MRAKLRSITEEIKSYWDQHPIGVEWIEEPLGSRQFYEKYLEYYDDFYDYKREIFKFHKYKGQKVLEIGCGLGLDSIKFAQSGADLTCVDLSDTSVKCTRSLLDQYRLKANVCQQNVEALDFPDDFFDVVYACGVLMHTSDERRAFEEVYRVLKPGGEALVVVYHRRSWYWLLVSLAGTNVESAAGDPPINRVHSLREVDELFKAYAAVEVSLDRFPKHTRRRSGLPAFLFNWILVPFSRVIPRRLLRPFGWHIIVKAVK